MQFLHEGIISFLSVKLRIIERAVKSAFLHELIMCTAFGNSSVLKHEDTIGVLNGGKAVSYHEAGTVPHKCRHCFPDFYLGARVNV